eukprot:852548_1
MSEAKNENNLSTLEIVAKLPSGKTMTLNIDSANTIDDIKQSIQDSQGLPIADQKIIFAGSECQNDQVVTDCGIKNKSQIFVLLKQ